VDIILEMVADRRKEPYIQKSSTTESRKVHAKKGVMTKNIFENALICYTSLLLSNAVFPFIMKASIHIKLRVSNTRPSICWRRRLPIVLGMISPPTRHAAHRWTSTGSPLSRMMLPCWCLAMGTAFPDAAQQAQEQHSANGRGNTYHKTSMAIDPASDFFESVRALTLSVIAPASSSTGGSIKEVLLHAIAGSRPKLGRSTGKLAVAVVTGVGVVGLGN
jgi:hypothetical protein